MFALQGQGCPLTARGEFTDHTHFELPYIKYTSEAQQVPTARGEARELHVVYLWLHTVYSTALTVTRLYMTTRTHHRVIMHLHALVYGALIRVIGIIIIDTTYKYIAIIILHNNIYNNSII